MKDKVAEIAKRLIEMTDSHHENDVYDYMESESKKHNVDMNKVFLTYTGMVAIQIMDAFSEADYDFFCISQHKQTKTATYGQTFDIDQLAELLSKQIPVQAVLRKALEKANQININDGQYVQLKGGEA